VIFAVLVLFVVLIAFASMKLNLLKKEMEIFTKRLDRTKQNNSEIPAESVWALSINGLVAAVIFRNEGEGKPSLADFEFSEEDLKEESVLIYRADI